MNVETIKLDMISSYIDEKLIESIRKDSKKASEVGFPAYWDETKLYSLYILWKRDGLSINQIYKYIKGHWNRSVNRGYITKKLEKLENELYKMREENPAFFIPKKESKTPFLLNNPTKTPQKDHFLAKTETIDKTEKTVKNPTPGKKQETKNKKGSSPKKKREKESDPEFKKLEKHKNDISCVQENARDPELEKPEEVENDISCVQENTRDLKTEVVEKPKEHENDISCVQENTRDSELEKTEEVKNDISCVQENTRDLKTEVVEKPKEHENDISCVQENTRDSELEKTEEVKNDISCVQENTRDLKTEVVEKPKEHENDISCVQENTRDLKTESVEKTKTSLKKKNNDNQNIKKGNLDIIDTEDNIEEDEDDSHIELGVNIPSTSYSPPKDAKSPKEHNLEQLEIMIDEKGLTRKQLERKKERDIIVSYMKKINKESLPHFKRGSYLMAGNKDAEVATLVLDYSYALETLPWIPDEEWVLRD